MVTPSKSPTTIEFNDLQKHFKNLLKAANSKVDGVTQGCLLRAIVTSFVDNPLIYGIIEARKDFEDSQSGRGKKVASPKKKRVKGTTFQFYDLAESFNKIFANAVANTSGVSKGCVIRAMVSYVSAGPEFYGVVKERKLLEDENDGRGRTKIKSANAS